MMEIRDGESVTAFTMRRIRAEIIEECANAAESELVFNDEAYNRGIRSAVTAIRALIEKE